MNKRDVSYTWWTDFSYFWANSRIVAPFLLWYFLGYEIFYQLFKEVENGWFITFCMTGFLHLAFKYCCEEELERLYQDTQGAVYQKRERRSGSMFGKGLSTWG